MLPSFAILSPLILMHMEIIEDILTGIAGQVVM